MKIHQIANTASQKVFIALVFIVIITLAGCATREGYEKNLKKWEGIHVDDLISVWGAPDKSYDLERGGRVIEYLEREEDYTYSLERDEDYIYSWNSLRGYSVTYTCNTRFTINKKGYIVKYSFDGNNCLAVTPD